MSNSENKSSYLPIYLIFAYVILTNLLISFHTNFASFMPNFMASFFLVFSFFKLLDLKGFADGFSRYDIVAKHFLFYAYVYPFLELIFGFSYIVTPNNLGLNIIVFIVMLLATIGVILSKLQKQQFNCACVGTFLKVPLGNIAIIEDLLMVIMAFLMIIKIHNI